MNEIDTCSPVAPHNNVKLGLVGKYLLGLILQSSNANIEMIKLAIEKAEWLDIRGPTHPVISYGFVTSGAPKDLAAILSSVDAWKWCCWMSTPEGPLGKMWVHLLRLDVNLMVTCDGSNGLMRARPVFTWRVLASKANGVWFGLSSHGDPALPTTTLKKKNGRRRIETLKFTFEWIRMKYLWGLNLRSSKRSSFPLGLRTWELAAVPWDTTTESSKNRFGMVTAADLARDELNRLGALIKELLKPSPEKKNNQRITQLA